MQQTHEGTKQEQKHKKRLTKLTKARRREMNRRMDTRKDNMVRMFQQMQIQMWTLYRHWVDTIRDEDRDMRDDLDFRYKVLSAEMDEAWDTVTAACQNIADFDQLD